MNKERRLGRGLEALLGKPLEAPPAAPAAPQPAADAPVTGITQVNVYSIDSNPYQPRRDFDEQEVGALSESIKELGLIHPLLVRRDQDRYQLISGERRLRAAIKAGWSEVPVQVREADDREMAEIAIVENMLRKDLNPLEKAASFQQYLARYSCTQEDLAGRLKIDRSTIANLIRLLELPQIVQDAIHSGAITQGHARALLPLGDEREQIEFCQRIERDALSVRATEALVGETIDQHDRHGLSVVSADDPPTKPKSTRSEHVAALEQEFRTALGTKVDVRQSAKGRGRVVIHFKSHEEFERLKTLFCGDVGSQSHAG